MEKIEFFNPNGTETKKDLRKKRYGNTTLGFRQLPILKIIFMANIRRQILKHFTAKESISFHKNLEPSISVRRFNERHF